MWGEVLAAFVGAISGGAVLALLTWEIYRKERFAYLLKNLIEVENKIRNDSKILLFDFHPEPPNSPLSQLCKKLEPDNEGELTDLLNGSSDPMSARELLSEIRPCLVDIQTALRAHFPEHYTMHETLENRLVKYLVARIEYIEYKINTFPKTLERDQEAFNKLNASIEILETEVKKIITHVEPYKLSKPTNRVIKQFLFLSPSRWK